MAAFPPHPSSSLHPPRFQGTDVLLAQMNILDFIAQNANHSIMFLLKCRGWAPLWLLTGVLSLQFVDLSAASAWNRFRGPNGTGVLESSVKLSQLSMEDLAWKLELPGEGHSSPVLWGQTLFLTSMNPQASSFYVVAIDTLSGKVNWSREVAYEAFSKHDFNSFASPSPTVDETGVYIAWARPESLHLASLTHQGQWRWDRDLGPYQSQHGVGVSPILYQGKVIMANDQLGKSSLIALDKANGSLIWQTPRNSDKAAYSTPCLYQAEGEAGQLIFNSAADGITGVDPSNGQVIWSYPKAFDKRSCSSPIVAGGKIFGSCGSGGGGNYVVALNPPNASSANKVELAYEIRRSANYVPTPLALGDIVYFWSDGGILTAADPKTGRIHYQERVGGRYFGSPVATGGEILCVSTTGELVVVEAGPTFKTPHRLDLGALCHATPALSEEALYVRTAWTLHKFHQP